MANDKNTLLNQVANLLPDNNIGEISASDLRTVESASISAALNLFESSQQVALGTGEFPAVRLTPRTDTPALQEGLAWYNNTDKTLSFYDAGKERKLRDRAGFIVQSTSSIAISSVSTSTTFIPNLVASYAMSDFEIDVATGSIKNISGRTIPEMAGTFSAQPSKTGGAASEVYAFSESSMDKITWTKNTLSGRVYSVTNTGLSFQTTLSQVSSWLPNQYIRFKFYATDATISFIPASFTADGVTVTGRSFAWELKEV